MAVKIRLAKVGRKHQIAYRVLATDQRSKRDGRFLEILGYYCPYLKDDNRFNVKKDRINYWLGKGAKPTEAVTKLLKSTTNQKLEAGSKKLDKDVGSGKKKSHLSLQ